jgi:hypothetical protein
MLPIDTLLLDNIAKTIKTYPHKAIEITHGFKHNQLISKQRVIEHIPPGRKVVVLGGWFALSYTLLNLHTTNHITSIDIDPLCEQIGKRLHYNIPNVVHKTENALHFPTNSFDIIINTSTEHMNKEHLQFSFANYDKGKYCIFQNNNMFNVADHINCFTTKKGFSSYISEQFEIINECNDVLDNGYSRFTIVCTKR